MKPEISTTHCLLWESQAFESHLKIPAIPDIKALNNVGLKITQRVAQLWGGKAPSQFWVILTQCIGAKASWVKSNPTVKLTTL